MYESFYQLQSRPFIAAPQVDRYFPAKSAENARQNLIRCIDRAEGAGLLIGPSGSGKSLVCQLLAEQYRETYAVALLSNGHIGSRRALLQAILFELGLPYRRLEEGELRLSLIDHLEPSQDCPRGMLLIVDEAHALPARLLDELRMITNLVRDGQPRVRLVLAGNSQLEEHLASPRLESFAQRIAVRCYLESMSQDETVQYVARQIAAVGGNVDRVFTPDALIAVHRATDGIPRLINQVCDHALVLAFAGGQKPIDAAGIEEAWADLQQLPTPWNETRHPLGNVIEFGSLEDLDDPVEPELSLGEPAAEIAPEVTAAGQLERISAHLDELEDEFEPAGKIEPRLEPQPAMQAAHPLVEPFSEPFAEEEILLDRYAPFDSFGWTRHPQVYCAEGRTISAILDRVATVDDRPRLSLAPHDEEEQPAAAPVVVESQAPVSSVTSAPRPEPVPAPIPESSIDVVEPNEDEIIVVEDDPRIDAVHCHRAPVVRRHEFRQLFARLRRG